MQIQISISGGDEVKSQEALEFARYGLLSPYSVRLVDEDRRYGQGGYAISATYHLTERANGGDKKEPAEYWQQHLSSGSVNTDEVQGCMTGYAIGPLESAIESTIRIIDERMASDRSPSLSISSMLVGHLEELLAEQLRRLTPTGGE